MAYDTLIESVRMIETGVVSGREGLTRRRRWLAVGVDVVEDIAGTVFVRRAHGGAEWQIHLLTRDFSGWQLAGGGGSGPDDLDVLTRLYERSDLGGHGRVVNAAGVLAGSGGGWRSRDRWLQLAIVATTPTVADLALGDGRVRDRPDHGYITVVWQGRTPIVGDLRDSRGQTLQLLQLG